MIDKSMLQTLMKAKEFMLNMKKEELADKLKKRRSPMVEEKAEDPLDSESLDAPESDPADKMGLDLTEEVPEAGDELESVEAEGEEKTETEAEMLKRLLSGLMK